MDQPPATGELSALTARQRTHRRDLWKAAAALAVITVGGMLWHSRTAPGQEEDGSGVVQTLAGFVLPLLWLIVAISLALAALSYASVTRRISRARSMQAAAALYPQLPPALTACLAGKAWQWRTLRASGIIMSVTFCLVYLLNHFRLHRWQTLQDGISLISAVLLVGSAMSFVVAAVRFVGYARQAARREQDHSPPPEP